MSKLNNLKKINKKIAFSIGAVILSCAMAIGVWAYVQATSGVFIYIYRFDTANNKLIPERNIIPYDSIEAMIQSVAVMMYTSPRGGNLQATIPYNLLIEEILVSNNIMSLFFTQNYDYLPPYQEAILRASLTSTMLDLPFVDIEGVYIVSGDSEIVDSFGNPIGMQTSENVLVNPEIMPRMMSQRNLTLYFVSTDLELVAEQRHVEVPTFAVERAIVEELISGSQFYGRVPAVPVETIIIDVRVAEHGIVSINLSSEFVTGFLGSHALAELTIQSIVQSIMENVGTINSIQFLIESERVDNFNGVPYFDTLFERGETE